MTTQVPPFQHGNFEGDLGYSYVFAAQRILLVMQDRLNALDLGVVPLVGDFAGTGTDTIRVTHMGNIGWSLPMTALGSETDTITPSNLTTGYSTVALGMYGLGHA
jgi:adenosylcobinamide amidohydrolase